MKIVTSEQMRQIEQACAAAGLPPDVLMENAGKAVAVETRRVLGNLLQQPILCLVGPGNNGGDGLVAARYLSDGGADVSVYLCAPRPSPDPNLELVTRRGIACLDVARDESFKALDGLLATATGVIDAVFGTGKVRPFRGRLQQALERVAGSKRVRPGLQIVAVDLPSGLNADTGAVDPACLCADVTVTLGFPKPGLFAFPGVARVGKLAIADIGIPSRLADKIPRELLAACWAGSVLPRRPPDANKGTFGSVLVVAGSINYVGAAYLACSGAMRVGAGLVTLATPASLQPMVAAKLTEATYLPLPESSPGIVSLEAVTLLREQSGRYNAMVVGCGLGQSEAVMEFIGALLAKSDLPALVLDADALNALAKTPGWWQHTSKDAILTPHPGEMARLCGKSVAEVQADRLGTAERFAREWGQTIVLKGAYTVVAAPDGRSRVCPFANPGLATAGTGDVLAGAIGGLRAQGLSAFDAAALGVYLHGAAAEAVRAEMGDAGMIASDLLPVLPVVIKRLKSECGG